MLFIHTLDTIREHIESLCSRPTMTHASPLSCSYGALGTCEWTVSISYHEMTTTPSSSLQQKRVISGKGGRRVEGGGGRKSVEEEGGCPGYKAGCSHCSTH